MTKWLLCLVVAALVPGWLTYLDPANKYSIDYPKDWTKATIPTGIAFLSPKESAGDIFQENVNVMVQDLTDPGMTLDQFTAFNKKQLVDNIGASAVISILPAKLAGESAKVALYSMNYQGHPLKIKQFWFIKNKKSYILTYTAFPAQYTKYEGTATQVINSFRFN
jgi:PsbP